jgi:hypothetical protein
MLRVDRVSLALLVTLAFLAIAGPAVAHVASPVAAPATVLPVTEAPAAIPALTAAPTAPAVPWFLFAALAAALALAALTARRRPRRAVAVTLALLLCVFAFENALHSVHHGFDAQQQEACTVAAASAHLAAVQVDDPGLSSIVLPVVGPAEAAPPASIPTRFLSPDQGRAPPSAIL